MSAIFFNSSNHNLQLDYFESAQESASSGNISLTLDNIRLLLSNPSNYPSSYKASLTRRNTLIIVFYLTIVVVSLFGNLLVCYVILKRKRMRIATNLLMANMALSDLCITIINIPFNIARILLNQWPFGALLCVFVPFVQVTSVYVSTLTMTIIAIDRYRAILKPLHKRITTSVSTWLIIFLIWLTSAIFSMPNVAFNRVVDIVAGYTNLQRCRAVYPSPEQFYRKHITLFTFLTQYAIPLSITTFAYIRISFNIWRKFSFTQNKSGAAGKIRLEKREVFVNQENNSVLSSTTQIKRRRPSSQTSITRTSRRKSIKMLAIVVGVFSICWLPLNIFHLISDFSTGDRIIDPDLFFICHWFAMSSVCYNPFIYFWLNSHYRQEIKHLLQCTNTFCFETTPEASSFSLVNRQRFVSSHHKNNDDQQQQRQQLQQQQQQQQKKPKNSSQEASKRNSIHFSLNQNHFSQQDAKIINCRILLRSNRYHSISVLPNSSQQEPGVWPEKIKAFHCRSSSVLCV